MAYFLDNKKRINFILLSLFSFLSLCFNIEDFGARGFIPSLLLAFISYYLYDFLNVKLNYLKNSNSFKLFIDAVGDYLADGLFVFFFIILRLLLQDSAFNFIEKLFELLMLGIDNIVFVLLFVLLGRTLWFFGVHGSNIMTNLFTPLLFTAFLYNSEAYYNGIALPYTFTIIFVYTWTIFGILPMVLALKLCGKKKDVVTVALGPATFNLGEPLIFGLPIVQNKKILVPYLTCFTLNGIIPFILTKMNILTRAFAIFPYRIPAIVRIYFSSLDFNSVIVYITLMVINILIYIPWFKRIEE